MTAMQSTGTDYLAAVCAAARLVDNAFHEARPKGCTEIQHKALDALDRAVRHHEHPEDPPCPDDC